MSQTAIPVLIVDDEPLGRDVVRHMLRPHPDFAVLDECSDGLKALSLMGRLEPRVVFLDVHMPGLDGLKLLEKISPSKRPLIVFITAHDEHAVRAFEEQALDYLLKPFDQDRFDATIARIRQRLEKDEAARIGQSVRQLLTTESPRRDNAHDERLVVRDAGRVHFVATRDIRWLEAEGNYVAIHGEPGKTHLLHETMNSVEKRLDPALFLRVHRSTIVSIPWIKELQPHSNGEYFVILKDGSRHKLSRGQVGAARARLGIG